MGAIDRKIGHAKGYRLWFHDHGISIYKGKRTVPHHFHLYDRHRYRLLIFMGLLQKWELVTFPTT